MQSNGITKPEQQKRKQRKREEKRDINVVKFIELKQILQQSVWKIIPNVVKNKFQLKSCNIFIFKNPINVKNVVKYGEMAKYCSNVLS